MFVDVLRDGTAQFAEATVALPASVIRARGDRRRRGRVTASAVCAVAAVAGIAGFAFASVPHRAAPPIRPAASSATSTPAPEGVAIAVRAGETTAAVFRDLTTRFGWSEAQLEAAVHGGGIDLPAWAVVDGRPSAEGMLEPGSYQAVPADGPLPLLRRMVDARVAELDRSGFVAAAASLRCGTGPCTPEQALVIASIAQTVDDDPSTFSGVSEVVLGRLRAGKPLGIDQTTAYGLDPTGARHPRITAAQMFDAANPYSSGGRPGLPPGPIANPSDEALNAAVKPTRQGYYFYCMPVNGRMVFFTQPQTVAFLNTCAS